MARLAQTAGLTEIQQEILPRSRRSWTRRSSRTRTLQCRRVPAGHRRRDEGDGAIRPHDPGGVRRARRVAADLRPGRRADRARVDERLRVINTHFIVAYMLTQHGTPSRSRSTCRRWPRARCADRSRCPSRPRQRRRGDQDAGRRGRRRVPHRRRQDVADQRRHVEPDRRAGAHRRGRRRRRTDYFVVVGRRLRRGRLAQVPGKIDKMGYKGVDTTEMVFDGYRIGKSRSSAASAAPGSRR